MSFHERLVLPNDDGLRAVAAPAWRTKTATALGATFAPAPRACCGGRILRPEASPTHACAWCDRELDMRPGTVRGAPSANWGMCPDCLSKRLVALMAAPLEASDKPLQPLDFEPVTAP